MSATRKPWLTRRRVIAGAVVLVLVLAVAGSGFGVFDDRAAPPLRIAFVRFETSLDKPLTRAFFTISNRSEQKFLGVSFDEIESAQLHPRGSQYLEWRPQYGVFTGPHVFMLTPLGQEMGTAELPQDGGVRKIAMRCFIQPRKLRFPFNKLREAWWNKRGWEPNYIVVECEARIQCPLVQPDGTVQPPRLLPKTEGKSP